MGRLLRLGFGVVPAIIYIIVTSCFWLDKENMNLKEMKAVIGMG